MYQPDKLKARRKKLKLTQREIANKLGISFQSYSAWERGIKKPSKERVKELEEILKVSTGYFTESEIIQLYNTLSTTGQKQVLKYAQKLVNKEKSQAIKNSLNTMFMKRCLQV